VRYPKEHKHQTRQRIVTTAGRRLKHDGIDGSGVATLMKDAGLTNGTFYAYFTSKDDLVATAVADQLRAQHENIVNQAAPGRAGLEQITPCTSRVRPAPATADCAKPTRTGPAAVHLDPLPGRRRLTRLAGGEHRHTQWPTLENRQVHPVHCAARDTRRCVHGLPDRLITLHSEHRGRVLA
jgi:AcrR family transcriptional regulator